jgi:4-hydroxybenzoate polyprenyltransferase/phosphoserine phosphatase
VNINVTPPVIDGGSIAVTPAIPRPLVVDLDGTLIKTDLLVESFLHLLARHPFRAFAALGMLTHGKAAFKAKLADEAALDLHLMPLDGAVCDLIAERRAKGGQVALASASDARYVHGLATHLGWFDTVFGTTDNINLSGHAKADKLVATYGEEGFDYVGNHKVDFPIWEKAHTAYLVGGDAALGRALSKRHRNSEQLAYEDRGIRPYLKAIRPHQWLKNLLIFLPAVAGHTLIEDLPTLIIAFVAFSLCASSVYVPNDLLDLAGDRDHPRKKNRPFASGQAAPIVGAFMVPILLISSFGLSLFLPFKFMLALAVYYVLTIAYSFYLKRKPVVDVMVLACLYGLRVVAGAYASETILSPWLEALAIFLFLCLALVKRCAELVARQNSGKGELTGRGYRLADLPILEAMAAAAGYNSALVLAIYINTAPERFAYGHPHRLWVLCVLLLAWISRVLVLTRRGDMNDDPVIFAVRDKWSLIIGACCTAVVVAALF